MYTKAAVLFLALALSTQCFADDVDPYVASGLVPDILTAPPPAPLHVVYSNGLAANYGNELEPKKLAEPPTFSWEYEENALYTVIMLDPDVPSRTAPIARSFLHFLAMNVKANDVYNGKIISPYVPPSPLLLSGPHRYLILVFKQYPDTSPVTDKEEILLKARIGFSLENFAKKHYLGVPIAGNFFIAQAVGLSLGGFKINFS